jgi:flagellin-specific chaperone FliS
MLIEGAIRQANLTADHWLAGRDEEALETLIRCRAIISELIAGVKGEETPLGRKVVALYLFLFTTLTEAQLTRDAAKLKSAVRVLEEERQTWTEICRQLADEQPAAVPEARPHIAGAFPGAAAASSFSLDA